MRVSILTTDTLHHAQFVRALAEDRHDLLALLQTDNLFAPFETAHPFEMERDAHEREVWFGGADAHVGDFAPARTFPNVNDASAIAALRDFQPDLTIVFGTGLCRAPLIDACGVNMFNLHGGDPELYRGLDTHLWAVWHNDFAALSTSLHRVSAGIDEGDIVATLPLEITRGSGLFQLRQTNTNIL